ncbi:MAG: NAD(P)H-dependent oxidoreductase [Chitinophagaceae bacterium]
MIITVISGTARNDSKTLRVANLYHSLLQEKQAAEGEISELHLLSLQGLPVWERGDELRRIEQEILIPSTHFIFVMPEYNGSFPGILKTMIDNTDIRSCWRGKKALLTGVADGRAGNLRGLDHMTAVLQYLQMHVHWNKLPLSRINEEISADGKLLKADTKAVIEAQIMGFLE